MYRFLIALLLVLLVVPPVGADICFFGYTGAIDGYQRFGTYIVAFYSWLYQEKVFYGINVNAGHVFTPDDYTLLRDAFPAIVDQFADYNTKMVLDFGNMIFERKTSGTANCSEYGGSSSTPLGTGVYHQRRSDWLTRVNDFINTRGSLVTPANTLRIIVHGEVNNKCIPSWQINQAAQALRSGFPGIPIIAVYELRSDIAAAKGLPTLFPNELDRVGFFAYGVYDPNRPLHNKNHTVRHFYNPNNPLSTNTQWGDMISRLRAGQDVDGTLEAYYSSRQAAHGWTQADLAGVANNWRVWAASQPRLGGLLAFKWTGAGGTSELLSQSVPGLLSAHRQFANAITSCP